MQDRSLRATSAASALILALAGAFASEAYAEPVTPPRAAPATIALPAFDTIVQRVGPAVVNISTEGTTRTSNAMPGLSPDDPFYEFFRRFGPQAGPQGEQPTRSQGSGFIVSADGIVLTNAHVVEGANEVTVKLTDKREFKAKVLGVDKPTDVAVLKIDGRNLPTVPLGDPQKSRVGDWVLAIGSPFGFENSVTAGIISAKARRLPDETYVPFIQTDVAINPGNSGGPLFNLAGEVIGINSQIYSRSGGFMGISFAIPIDVAMNVKDQLVAHGRVQRGRLGIAIQGVDKELAQSFGLAEAHGALVASVDPGSAAEKAGLQPGDVVLQVDGRRISDSAELPRVIGEKRPGTQVRMEIWRDGRSRSVTATLDELTTDTVAAADPLPSQVEKLGDKLGLSARALTAQEASELRLRGGLAVESVDGAAARAGLQRGDVILAINNQPVTTIAEFRAQLQRSGNRFALLIQRGSARIFVPVRIE